MLSILLHKSYYCVVSASLLDETRLCSDLHPLSKQPLPFAVGIQYKLYAAAHIHFQRLVQQYLTNHRTG